MALGEARVRLVAVDDTVLELLVGAATAGAAPAEVTPPLTDDDAWTTTRIAWLNEFHRARRAGLDGPAGESTWAVMVEQRVVGSVRLVCTESPGQLETGIWLTRDTRGRGIGQAAVAATLRVAAELGATSVSARTTAGNAGALAVLERLGFSIGPGDHPGSVHALLVVSRAAAYA